MLYQSDKKGFILYFALGIMMLIAMLVFAYNTFVRGDAALTFHVVDAETSDAVTQSVLNITIRELFDKINDFDVAVGKKTTIDLSGNPFLKVYKDKYGSLFSMAASFTILTKRAFPQPAGLRSSPDPQEGFGTILIEVATTYKGVRRYMKDVREYKLVNIIPPVYSHFTIFVRDAGKDGQPLKYNAVLCDEDGRCVSDIKPLELNNGSSYTYPLEKRGWIFLGGGRLVLKLGQGYEDGGEAYHLIQDPTRVELPTNEFVIVNRYMGFCDELKDEETITGKVKDFRSSYFKLFADEKDPSHTVVLGDVHRAFIKFAAVFEIINGKIFNPAILPWLPAGSNGLSVSISEKLEIILENYENYSKYMTNVIITPYNHSFDFLYGLKLESRPPVAPPEYLAGEFNSVFDPAVKFYPNDGKVNLSSDLEKNYFTGDLNSLDIADHFISRAGMVFSSQDGFKNHLKNTGGEVCGIFYIKSDVDLTAIHKLTGGGIIIADNDILLSKIESDHPLSFISLNGNISLAGELSSVSVTAVNGKIASAGPLSVNGFIACAKFEPEDNKQGGALIYNPDFNPCSDNYRKYKRLMVAPNSIYVMKGFVK
ncbi:MAG: hypothetical protein A2008_02325 [Candidatus Wallbacteria bacterium GWC2_49_35]|uniref:Uncharacterized protein n=1 Tax=Candidatus Wallbacteria bacterium GWC2_49_35 TaxID=1817813 RepID=A0A1F7WXY3_9BACT|nr:MAG: hypothetical protein A2008_02325 [Candidatus Wallbacteria bacterium GWC2_49_35]